MHKSNHKYAEIIPLAKIDRAYTYIIPEKLTGLIRIGSLVLIPLRNSYTSGIVVKIRISPGTKVKLSSIADILEEAPVFTTEMIKFLNWIAEYYITAKGEVYRTALPPGITQKSMDVIRLNEEVFRSNKDIDYFFEKEKEIVKLLKKKKEVKLNHLKKKFGDENLLSSLRNLEKNNLIEYCRVLTEKKGKKIYRDFVKLSENWKTLSKENRLGKNQQKALDFLKNINTEISKSELTQKAGISYSSLKKLIEGKIIEVFQKEIERSTLKDIPDSEFPDFELTDEQKQAVSEIKDSLNKHKVYMIYGVTGSGKTLIYNKLIEEVLNTGGSVIFLVPEIFMSSQTICRFKSKYSKDIATIHSQMSAGERYETWENIRSGRKRFIIGPRSAIFAPAENLKLLVVDEEHDSSYKQSETSPFYNARDLAVIRGSMTDSVVVLGSATPAIESYYNAQSGKYSLIKITHRADKKPMPEIQIIDMKEEFKKFPKQSNIISEHLLGKIWQYLLIKEQVLLLQNRRGFSAFVQCRECGYTEQCKFCSITLTFHKYEKRLKCHYCGYTLAPPTRCPNCNGESIFYPGTGTQKLEEEIKEKIPDYPIVRIDSDILSSKKRLWQISKDIQGGKHSIILGTQIISKGLDLANLNFVGVVNADIGLFLPDFRASEHTFQILSQVSGRAGRREDRGEVVIQTYNPESIALKSCKGHNFEMLYDITIPNRKELGYPPFSRLILLKFKHRELKICENEAKIFAAELKKSKLDAQILGPSPSVIFKVKNNFRYQILVKIRDRSTNNLKLIKTRLIEISKDLKNLKSKLTIDVDPIDMI